MERTTFVVPLGEADSPAHAQAMVREACQPFLEELHRRGLEETGEVTFMVEDSFRFGGTDGVTVMAEFAVRRVPSPYDQAADRLWPIMGMNDDLADQTAVCDSGGCAYGICHRYGMQGCGGCCGCRGGCQAEWERRELAPYVWEGDQA